jgi:hypothetical protein
MTDTNKERAEFEAWAVNEGFQIRRLHNPEAGRDYGIDFAKDCIWAGWQARASLAASAPVAPAPITEAEQAAWHAGLDEGRSQARGAAQAAPAEPDMRSVALAAGAYTTAYSMLTHAKVHNADVDGSTKRLVAAINGLRSALGPSAPVAEDAEIRKALHDAATSLETISRIAGRDQCMLGMMDVRLYAAARSKVAREALAAQPEGGA